MRGLLRHLLAFTVIGGSWGAAAQEPATSAPAQQLPASQEAYRVYPDASELWACSGPATLQTLPARASVPGALLLNWGEVPAADEVRLLLRSPLSLQGVRRLEIWACQPLGDGDHCLQGKALLRGAKGEDKPLPLLETVNTHIGPASSRLAAIWRKYRFAVPEGAREFRGFAFTMRGKHPVPGGSRLYLRGLAADGLDYWREPLYYVVGNYRDNYRRVAFNGCGAREMRGAVPEVLLDNLLDPAKNGRPEEVRLVVRVYDAADRLVCVKDEGPLAARDPQDFLHPFVLPILAPGTYRVEGRSFHVRTGEYFTTDWTQLIIIRSPQQSPAPLVSDTGLNINRAVSFGVFAPGDAPGITLVLPPGAPASATLEYAVIPWEPWAAKRSARREVRFTATLPALPQQTVPYHPAADAEIVVAQLRAADGRILDRAERDIGIANGFPVSGAAQSVVAAAAGNQPVERQDLFPPMWVNSILMDIEGQLPGQAADYIRRNAAALKALGPNTGLYPDQEAMEPLPGVYNTGYLRRILDAGRDAGCPVLLYLSQKWPPSWAPVEFYLAPDGTVGGENFVWRHMCGAYNYSAGTSAPERIRRLNADTAQRFGRHPGLAALYFENEHLVSGMDQALAASCAPQCVAAYRAHLQERYFSLDALNAAYARQYASFSDVPYPPLAAEGVGTRAADDWRDYLLGSAEEFMLEKQVLAARRNAPQLPLILYANMLEQPLTQAFYRRLRDSATMLANGGVHADLAQPLFREAVGSVPGLRERMEPHAMWTYQPTEFGIEDMLYGMLALGGRGLNFQALVRIIPWDPDYTPEKIRQATGFDRLQGKWSVLEELSRTQKLHDSFGILVLQTRSRGDVRTGSGASRYPAGLLPFALQWMGAAQRNPKILFAPGNTEYLADLPVLLVLGEAISSADADWLESYVRSGGTVLLTPAAATLRADGPTYDLVAACAGITAPLPDKNELPVQFYQAGRGKIIRVLQGGERLDWGGLARQLLTEFPATFSPPLFSCDTPGMRAQVLRDGMTLYLVTMYFPHDRHRRIEGQERVRPLLRFFPPIASDVYRCREIWEGAGEQTITRQEMAAGFSGGEFRQGQMRIFRMVPAQNGQ